MIWDMTPSAVRISHALLDFIDASPSPHHVVAAAAGRLEREGFVELSESSRWGPENAAPGGRFVRRGGSLLAWRTAAGHSGTSGFRIVGAHTDSPNLRVKPRPDTGSAGWRQLGVEVYGGALLNSWLDRDLGLSGSVVIRAGEGLESHLLHVNRPILRIPQLAIHLDKDISEKGLLLNRQTHLQPTWGLGEPTEGAFAAFLAAELGVDAAAVASWTIMTHDLSPPTLAGIDEEFISAPRIDNQASCFAAIEALATVAASDQIPVVCLFDHEEVGSVSSTGAGGALLPGILDRIGRSLDADLEDHAVALARSCCVSSDGAHATHPNYPERHEPGHQIALNQGPVIKQNANERYATGAESAATFVSACESAGVPVQWFVNRSDLACGSTIGPVTSAQLGIPTVDVGIPQLAMHSARELCGAADPALLVAALGVFLSASAG